MAKLLYGCGLRLMECVRLRVKDIDFEQNQVIIREGKGMKDRSTMLPAQLKSALLELLERVAPSTFNRLIKGQSNISSEMALRLSKTLGRSPESWLIMQNNYNLWQAKQTINLDAVEEMSMNG